MAVAVARLCPLETFLHEHNKMVLETMISGNTANRGREQSSETSIKNMTVYRQLKVLEKTKRNAGESALSGNAGHADLKTPDDPVTST